ncbi:hypothetical protein [Halomicrobium katesii]|uniref:hypothetical protein n=1 Tax=Halomicrobium katesii TaxID=437163 RepID=UPI00037C8C6D|nr:hypothetical protein [Halomicrobium katesii]
MASATPRERLPAEPDLLVGLAGLAVAVVLFPLRFLSGQLFIQVLPPVLGLGSLVYLVGRVRAGEYERAIERRRVGVDGRVVAGLTALGIGGLALFGASAGGRTTTFLLASGLVGTAILVQILFLDDDALGPGLVLGQLLALALVVRFTALLSTPGLIGVDSWTHLTDYAAAIQSTDSLSAIADVKYRTAPLFHVLVVIAADAIGVGLRAATYVSMGLALPLSTLLVYAIGTLLFDRRWALLAAGLFAMADHVIRWGVHIIPTSMGLVFFLGALAGTTRLLAGDTRRATYAIVVAFGIATALTHQISAFILLVVLGVGAVVGSLGSVLPGDFDRAGSLWPVFALVTAFVAALWSITPYRDSVFALELLDTVDRAIATSVGFLNLSGPDPGGAGGASSAAGVRIGVAFADALGFFALLFAVVIGTVAVFRRRNATPATVTVAAAAVVLATFTFGLPLFGFTTFLPGRWYAFMYAPMALLAALGCRFAVRRLSPRMAMTGLLVFALVVPGAMAINHKGTPESPVFDQEYSTYAYDETELSAVETVGATRPEAADPVYTDHPYRTVFERSGATPANMLAVEDGEIYHDTVVYRQYQSTGAPVVLVDNESRTRRVAPSEVCREDMHRLYANSNVTVCTGIDEIDGA